MLIFQATHGADDPERANLPFIRGTVAAAAGQTALVFLSSDAVWLATGDVAHGVRFGGHPSVGDMSAVFIANGGRVWVSAESAARRSIDGDQLIDGAELVPFDRLSALVADGATVLSG